MAADIYLEARKGRIHLSPKDCLLNRTFAPPKVLDVESPL